MQLKNPSIPCLCFAGSVSPKKGPIHTQELTHSIKYSMCGMTRNPAATNSRPGCSSNFLVRQYMDAPPLPSRNPRASLPILLIRDNGWYCTDGMSPPLYQFLDCTHWFGRKSVIKYLHTPKEYQDFTSFVQAVGRDLYYDKHVQSFLLTHVISPSCGVECSIDYFIRNGKRQCCCRVIEKY